ncbi:PxKF domain-containing protein [Terrabacter lapilli]|uniref:PxKF domain-containing protein n=1 Tax=Terrabacter lapilli TaxID=436231 RepID=UPI0031E371C3
MTPCSAQATGAGIATPIVLTPVYAANTNAGTADVTASWIGDANHGPNKAASTFTISKAVSTVKVACPSSSVYSGSALTPCSATATGAGITTPVILDPSYSANINVGTAHVDAAWAGDANHTAGTDSATFAITQAPSTVTISCTGAPYTYSGAPLTPCTARADGAGIGTPIALTPDYTANTNAGTADVTASWAGDANHSPSSAASTFAIDKSTSTVTVTCPEVPQTFTGSPQQPCTARANGIAGLDVAVDHVVYTDNTNAGTATAWATYDGDANHTSSSASATFAIGRYTPVVTVSCPKDATYSGTAHSCTATVQGVGDELAGATTTIDYGVGGNVDAGDVSVIATFTAPSGSNYSDATGRAQFAIAPYTPTVNLSCPTTDTYNALPHPCTATVSGIGHELAAAQATIDYGARGNVNAGAVTATATFAGSGNYSDGTATDTFTIARFTPTVTVSCPTTATYTAAPHPCSASVKGVGDELDAATVAIDYGTHGNVAAGDVTAVGSFAGDANYAPATGSDAFTIAKATPTVTVTCDPTSATYTGSAITPCSARATGVGGLDAEVTPVTYTGNTDAGEATAWATYDGDDNHSGASSNSTFTITKAATTVTVSCVGSHVFTGEPIAPCTAKVTGVGGLDLPVSPVGYANNTLVGTASASASYDGDANHTGSKGGATFAITKAPSTVTVSCPSSEVYTGLPIAPCTARATGVGGLDVPLDTVSHTDNVNVGTASASAAYGGDANHDGSTGENTFVITKAPSTVTVSCATSEVYTGSAITPCSALLTGAGLQATGLTVGYSGNVVAGTATASAAWAGDSNHLGSKDSATFEITKAGSSVAVTCTDSVVYTGGELAPCTARATGAGELDVAVTPVTYSDNVDAGTATAVASYAGDPNHEASSGTGHFEITKASSEVTVTCTGPNVYTGSPIKPCSAIATGAGGLDVSLTQLGYVSNTDAGTATATATYAGDDNHNASTGERSFDITPADSTVRVSCPASQVYTGQPIEPCSATVTGVGGLEAEVTPLTYEANTNTGLATAAATYRGDHNHNGSEDHSGFEIDKAPSTVTVTCPPSMTFTGQAIEPCSALLNGAGLDATKLSVGYENNTHAGTATASAVWAGDDNHTGADGVEHFTIDKATSLVTVTCNPTTVTYTGSPLEPCLAAASGAGGLAVALTPVLYGANVNAGPASASATYVGGDDHLGSTGTATFQITKADSTIVFTCPQSSVYTGSAITPCTARVTGAGGLDLPLDVSYAANTNAGTATASASYAGDGNHNPASKNVTFTITPAQSQVALTCPESTVYTGGAIEPCSATATGPGGLKASVAVTYTNNLNVGTAAAATTYAGDANHTGSTASATFPITKADSTVKVTCPTSSIVYSGSAITPCSALLTGAGLQATSLTVAYGSNVNAGTSTASAAWAGDDNHTSSSASTTFTISKAPSTTTVTCGSGSFTYNGSPITPCSARAAGAGGLDLPVTPVTYSSNTNAGAVTASAAYAGDANHESSTGTATFQIAKAASTVTVTCTAGPFVYTGSAFTPCAARATGAGGLDIPVTVTYTNNVSVGTATASATYAGDANHESAAGRTSFAIAAWSLKGFYQPVDMTPAGGTTVLNSVKAGSTVPLKFQIYSGSTELTNVSAVKSFTTRNVGCSLDATDAPIDITSTGGTSLRYDSTGSQFIQNWQTPKTPGACLQVTMTAQDNSTLSAYFKLK